MRDLLPIAERRIRRFAACLVLPYLPRDPGCYMEGTPEVEQCVVGATDRQIHVPSTADPLLSETTSNVSPDISGEETHRRRTGMSNKRSVLCRVVSVSCYLVPASCRTDSQFDAWDSLNCAVTEGHTERRNHRRDATGRSRMRETQQF